MTQKETTEKEYVEIPFSNVVQVAYDMHMPHRGTMYSNKPYQSATRTF